MNSTLKTYLLAGLSGVIFALSFPPMHFFPLGFIFIIPLLFALESKPSHWYRLTYTFAFFQHLLSIWWIGSWQENADIFLMISGIIMVTLHPFFDFLIFAGYKFFRKRLSLESAALTLPLIWTLYDWLKAQTEFAFPWLSIGYTQTYNFYWNQIADISSVYGIGLLLMYANVLIFLLISKFMQQHYPFKEYIKGPTQKKYVLALILIVLLPMSYSIIKMNEYSNSTSNKKLDIAVIQPSINPWNKWESTVSSNISRHKHIQDSLIAKHKINLALWTETAVTYSNIQMNSKPYNMPFLQEDIDKHKFSIITGFSEVYLYGKDEEAPATANPIPELNTKYQMFNAALLLSPEQYNDTTQVYRKMILTPFSERIPYLDNLSFLKSALQWSVGISNWGLGWEQKNLNCHTDAGTFKLAPIICIESTSPHFVRYFTKLGAEILLILTNDSWFLNTPGPAQHLAIAQMRAIENRRYIARCSNAGISGFIAPNGEIVDTLPAGENAGMIKSVPALNNLTVYASYSDVIMIIIALSLVAYIVLAIRAK